MTLESAVPAMPQRVVVLVGLPGSGKSTWAAQRGGVLSSDALRLLLTDDETDQTQQARVFLVLRYLLRQRLAAGRGVTYIDATNLTPEERRPYIAIARAYGCVAEAVHFDVAFATCAMRNRTRSRVVPEEILERMAARLIPPSSDEGFTRVTVLRS